MPGKCSDSLPAGETGVYKEQNLLRWDTCLPYAPEYPYPTLGTSKVDRKPGHGNCSKNVVFT